MKLANVRLYIYNIFKMLKDCTLMCAICNIISISHYHSLKGTVHKVRLSLDVDEKEFKSEYIF